MTRQQRWYRGAALIMVIGVAAWQSSSAQIIAASDASQIATFARTDRKLIEPNMAIAIATGDMKLLAIETSLDGVADATGTAIFGANGVSAMRAKRWSISQIAYLHYSCPGMIQTGFANELDSGIRAEVAKFGFQETGPSTYRYSLEEGDDWAEDAISDANRLVSNFGCSLQMLSYSRNLFAAAVGRTLPVGGAPVVASPFDTACQQERAKVIGRVTMGVRNHCSCLASSFGTTVYQQTGSIERYFKWLTEDERRGAEWARTCFQKEG